MAKIVAATLLLVILVDCFSDRTAHCDEFHTAGFTSREIRKCRCSVTSSGRMKCPHPLIPTNHKEQPKPCGGNQNDLFKAKKCSQPQTHQYYLKEKMTLKHCLCCRFKNLRDRPQAMKAFCSFTCDHPTPL